mmetsp:Transcript_51369/g.142200  ORF Transcript_51369/g.142200 Transcript_51369/m.142200 type:complete len:213 (-) Transcript_51369:367-1005(-)
MGGSFSEGSTSTSMLASSGMSAMACSVDFTLGESQTPPPPINRAMEGSGNSFRRRAPLETTRRTTVAQSAWLVPLLMRNSTVLLSRRGSKLDAGDVNSGILLGTLASSGQSSASGVCKPSEPCKLLGFCTSPGLPGSLGFGLFRTHGRSHGDGTEKTEVPLQCARFSSSPWMCATETCATRFLLWRKRRNWWPSRTCMQRSASLGSSKFTKA